MTATGEPTPIMPVPNRPEPSIARPRVIYSNGAPTEMTIPRGSSRSTEVAPVQYISNEPQRVELWVDRPAPVVEERRPVSTPIARTAVGERSVSPLVVLRERWVIAVATLLLVLVAAVGAGSMLPPSYDATATISLPPVSKTSNLPPGLESITPDTAALEAQSIGLADEVAKILDDGRTGKELLASLNVTNPMGADVLKFTFSSDKAADAAKVANLYAEQFLENQSEIFAAKVAVYVKQYTDTLATLDPVADAARIKDIEADLNGLPAATFPGRLSNEASVPSASSGPGTLTFAAAGVAAGLIFAVLAAIAADRLDPKVRNRRRMAEIYDGAIVFEDPRDIEEAPHKLLVLLRSLARDRVITRVAVIAADTKCGDTSVAQLQGQMESEAVRPQGISRGMPIYWIDARATASRARQLELAGAADMTVFVVGTKDRRGTVRETLGGLDIVGGQGVNVCLFVGLKKGERS